MQFDRAAGVLLHITSLPKWSVDEGDPGSQRLMDAGIGDLGLGAYKFVDFLEQAGQRVWQVLPLGPTVHGESPYSCYSAFAGNPLLIDLEQLVESELVDAGFVRAIISDSPQSPADRGDYGLAHQVKSAALEVAFERFLDAQSCSAVDDFESFCVKHRWWLDDFALFAALMKDFGTDDWTRWESALVSRESNALGEHKQRLAKRVEFEQFVQYVFYKQWYRLREYANSKGILLFGDMPIFVAHGSADVWAHQDLFDLDEHGQPQNVAGVPPDYFSATGQLWGNPLYNWDTMEGNGYRWWIQRFKSAFELFDLLRIDHFRGFEAYWSVPAGAKTAVGGQWMPGPGTAPFDAARGELGELNIVAEDLGLITDEVHALRDRLQFPGMRVLQFGFDAPDDGYHRPDEYPENCVAYTGTHDNSTIVGWYQAGRKNAQRCELLEPWLERQPADLRVHWQLLSMVFESKARTAIAPMQDVLGLDDTARMNIPGKAEGNWRWRCDASLLDDALAEQLKTISQRTGRV